MELNILPAPTDSVGVGNNDNYFTTQMKVIFTCIEIDSEPNIAY